ncbi:efflux transporter outer membrane subunit [Ilyomonas limi]|uniref:Efflux transporter outer membrane subunit n=1 Tax=Ilyomonas limi TaxID=2575867 RepID=A0A4U3KUW2_9BACT|nr:efflux transporter outer membrane subunit [Ilyomonas limi]TKK66132.1 efflux transporter outer membrane subunit [Ilyomonas limi]
MNDGHKRNQLFLILIIALLFASCVTQKYQQPGVAVKGQLYRDTSSGNASIELDTADTVSISSLPYTQLFSDTVLQNLIAEGISENLNLKIAIERINEANANFQQSRMAFLPGIDGKANVSRNKQSIASLNLPPDFIGTFPLAITAYQASISTSWEADIWGKLKSAKKAAFANLLQSDAAKRAIQTQLVAGIASYYYQLLSLDQQLKITEQTLETRIQEVETMKALKESAVVTGAAVVQSEANRYAAEVTIPDLKRSIRETENALSILLARTPGAIKRSTLEEQTIYTDLQTGIPSLLLKNRPDVQQAELAFRAAFENTNVARTYFYPQLTLTAEAGVSSIKIKDLFNRSIFYNIIGGLTQPIFNNGQNKARLRIAKAQQQEAYYAYQQSLLNAGAEVSDALYAYQTALEKQSSRTHQIEALEKAVDYTKELLQYSSATNYTDVLTSEQFLLSAQLGSVNDKLQQLQAVVNLYQALGGGW